MDKIIHSVDETRFALEQGQFSFLFSIFVPGSFPGSPAEAMNHRETPMTLDLVKRQDEYVIYRGDHPLLTAGGAEVAHSSGRLMKHILTDILLTPSGNAVLSFQLFEYQQDNLKHGPDSVELGIPDLVTDDPFIRIKSGRSALRKETGIAVTESGMELSMWVFSELLTAVNGFFEEQLKHSDLTEVSGDPFTYILLHTYQQLSPEQKSAIHHLVDQHRCGIVLPVLVILERITVAEYAKGVLSLKQTTDCRFDVNSLLQEASAIRDYLRASLPAKDSSGTLEDVIRSGEGDSLEFKSTLRWDLRKGKTGQHIERACLRTISAFLNSRGGTLLIGIRDNGSVEGIESDRLDTDDRWLLHLWTLIRTCFGKDFSPYIRSRLEKIQGKTVCRVECMRSPRPVFLKQPGFEEEFCIRVGPGNAVLAVSEALHYIADRFPGGTDLSDAFPSHPGKG